MFFSILKSKRELLGLTQIHVAECLSITKQTYLKWESGITEPKLSQVKELAEILHITESEICSGVLNERMPLEEFLILSSRYGHMEMMISAYKCLPDHDKYFNALSKLSCHVGE